MNLKRNALYGMSLFVLALWVAAPATGLASSKTKKDSKRWTAPAEAKQLKNPLPASKTVLKLGKQLFLQQCATCHGNSGKGDGMAGKFLPKKPADFHASVVQRQTDGELFWKITHGNPPMPAFDKILTEKQRWQLVHYLRTFKSK